MSEGLLIFARGEFERCWSPIASKKHPTARGRKNLDLKLCGSQPIGYMGQDPANSRSVFCATMNCLARATLVKFVESVVWA